MSTTAYYLAATALAIIIGVLVSREQTEPLQPQRHSGVVVKLRDGDSFKISTREADIRLWGVDAPEFKEKGFSEAKFALQHLIENRRVTFIEIDRDRYDRIVARVFLPDGREVNRLMIESGAAREYCRYSKGFYGRC